MDDKSEFWFWFLIEIIGATMIGGSFLWLIFIPSFFLSAEFQLDKVICGVAMGIGLVVMFNGMVRALMVASRGRKR